MDPATIACPSCSAPNEAAAKFCNQCGQHLAATCAVCSTVNPSSARFCSQCGTPFPADVADAADAAASASAPAPAPGAPEATAAERRLVSVLFVDLVGFTTISENRDAEETRDLLTSYFEVARGAIERHGGMVEKFIGDAVMAVWGAPVAREDDAERAVRAALELVDAVTPLGVTARAGVLTGEAAVTIGATNQGMVAGDLVNTASRLQSAAAPGTVLVGESTYRAAAGSIAFEPAGEQTLKGKAVPVRAWRALRVVAQRGGKGRSDMPEPPFVGRDGDLRLLKDLVAAAGRDRRTRLVSVTGPGGIGKSRLAWELEKYLDGLVEPVSWHHGRSPSYGEGITFWALGEMVRRRASLAESDDESTTRARIAATVAEDVPDEADRRWVEPALLTLLGLEPAPPGGRDVLFAAWRIFFERIAARGTTVLVFEDLQWADTGLLDFIDHLLEWLKGVPILVVTLARPELFDRRPDWGLGTRNFTGLALEPLPGAAMRELIAGLVPGLPKRAVKAIVERADGVPLYAVETVRMLFADGRLERAGDGYRPVGELGALAVPETLRSLIASRLDALEAADRSLIADAAVLGQTFTLAGLAAVSGRDRADLEARLRGLVRRELLEIEADPRSPERGHYRFIQSLSQEVAHATLARPERRARHLAAARYFESLGDEELAGALASHYLTAYEASAAGAEAEAVAVQAKLALRGAAERAATLGAHDQAVAYLEQALTVTTDPAEQAGLLEQAAASANAAALTEVAEGFARRAVELRRQVGDTAAVAGANALLGTILLNTGQIGPAIEFLEAALTELPEVDADEVKAELLATLSRAFMRNGAKARAVEVADLALALAEPLRLDRVIAEALNNKASSLFDMGRRRESIALMEAAIQIAQAGGFVDAELRARQNLAAIIDDDAGRVLSEERAILALAERAGNLDVVASIVEDAASRDFRRGDGWDGALARLDDLGARMANTAHGSYILGFAGLFGVARGLPIEAALLALDESAGRVSDPRAVAFPLFTRADIALMQGDYRAANEGFVAAADVFPRVNEFMLASAIRAALWLEDPDRARAAADRLDADPSPERATKASGVAARAGIAALEGRRDEAIGSFVDALRLFRELGFEFEVARVALDFLLLLGPEAPEARSAGEEARATFERLGAKPYLERLEVAMARATASPSESTAESVDESTPART